MACEILIATSAIRSLIRENNVHQIDSYIKSGSNEGMILMDDSLMKLFNTMSPFPVYWTDKDDYVKMNLRGMSFNMPEILRSWKGEQLSSREISQLQRILSQGALRSRLEKLMKPGGKWEKNYLNFKKQGFIEKEIITLVEKNT